MAIPFVPLKLDKTYNLRLGLGASYEFERLTSTKISKLDLDNFSISDIANLLFVMIKQEYKDITIEEVLTLVDDYADDIPSVMLKVAEAITASYEVKKKPKNG